MRRETMKSPYRTDSNSAMRESQPFHTIKRTMARRVPLMRSGFRSHACPGKVDMIPTLSARNWASGLSVLWLPRRIVTARTGILRVSLSSRKETVMTRTRK
jgi:hypothetical protein